MSNPREGWWVEGNSVGRGENGRTWIREGQEISEWWGGEWKGSVEGIEKKGVHGGARVETGEIGRGVLGNI